MKCENQTSLKTLIMQSAHENIIVPSHCWGNLLLTSVYHFKHFKRSTQFQNENRVSSEHSGGSIDCNVLLAFFYKMSLNSIANS
jgi:hypothetical protein